MATYVPEFQGYIADVPRLWFKRCDGRIFYFDELTAATVTPQVNYTEVQAGWSLYPVAYLPGQSTFEMNLTSGKFEADLFVMTNSTEFVENANYQTTYTETLVPDGNNEVELRYIPVTGTVSIAGMEETAQTPSDGGASGKPTFKVTIITGTGSEAVGAKVTFASGVVQSQVEVSYYYTISANEALIDNRSSAMGEAVLKWPVYGNGDDCTDAAIIGYAIMRVFKCRVTAQPGFDSSYKTAGTYQFTLAAMDAKRNDEKTYSLAYFKI